MAEPPLTMAVYFFNLIFEPTVSVPAIFGLVVNVMVGAGAGVGVAEMVGVGVTVGVGVGLPVGSSCSRGAREKFLSVVLESLVTTIVSASARRPFSSHHSYPAVSEDATRR